jgi:hypothetical protein
MSRRLVVASLLAFGVVRVAHAQELYMSAPIPVEPNQEFSNYSARRFATTQVGWTSLRANGVPEARELPDLPVTPRRSGLFRVYVDVMIRSHDTGLGGAAAVGRPEPGLRLRDVGGVATVEKAGLFAPSTNTPEVGLATRLETLVRLEAGRTYRFRLEAQAPRPSQSGACCYGRAYYVTAVGPESSRIIAELVGQ